MCEVAKSIKELENAEKKVINSTKKTVQTHEEERGKARKRLLEELKKDKIGSLTPVLEKISASLPSKMYTRAGYLIGDKSEVRVPLSIREKIDIQINRLMRSRIGDLIGETLMDASEEELQELATVVENQALLNVKTFDVSSTIHVDGLLSGMELIVQFYKSGVKSRRVLDFVNRHVIRRFDKLPENRKLDFLRALADISLFTQAPVSDDTLRSTVEILKIYMPDRKGSVFEEDKSSTHVECILYVFHHLADKAENPKTATKLCDQLRDRLKNVKLMTSPRISELRINLIDDEKVLREAIVWMMDLKFFQEWKKEETVNELRSCINIIGMTEVLLGRKIRFTGDKSVNLSWKESRKPVVSRITNTKYPKVPDRRDRVKSLPKDCRNCLEYDSICKVSKSQALYLSDLKESQLHNEDGEFRLHEDNEIGILFWKMKEKEIRKYADLVTWDRYGGAVRDQEFHLLCAAYVATDLVSSRRRIHELEDKNIALCTWYLCAHTDPEALGKDKRAREGHHCYGSSIENFLLHIQAHGVPREIFHQFDCKNHHPPTADDPWKGLRKIKAVKRIPTFKEAMRELRKGGPIGADLLVYSGLFELKNGIYYGPHQQSSYFESYHAVFIEAIKEMNGERVAVCKMSNGVDQGNWGYAYVSLATLYYPVSAVKDSEPFVRGLSEPSHLLSNFVSIELEGEEKPGERHDPPSTHRKRPPDSRDHSTHKRRQDQSPHKRARYSDSRSQRYRS